MDSCTKQAIEEANILADGKQIELFRGLKLAYNAKARQNLFLRNYFYDIHKLKPRFQEKEQEVYCNIGLNTY